jgi:hypothetical protein
MRKSTDWWDSMSLLHLCTHPSQATCAIASVYAGPSALTCVLAASNAGRALCTLRIVFMVAKRILCSVPEHAQGGARNAEHVGVCKVHYCPPTPRAAILMRMADQILDKRFNSLAQPSTTTICLDVALSWSSSLIIRKCLPSAVTS